MCGLDSRISRTDNDALKIADHALHATASGVPPRQLLAASLVAEA